MDWEPMDGFGSKNFWAPECSGPCGTSTTPRESFVEERGSHQALSLLLFALRVERVIAPSAGPPEVQDPGGRGPA